MVLSLKHVQHRKSEPPVRKVKFLGVKLRKLETYRSLLLHTKQVDV